MDREAMKLHIQHIIDIIDSGRIAIARQLLADLVEYEGERQSSSENVSGLDSNGNGGNAA